MVLWRLRKRRFGGVAAWRFRSPEPLADEKKIVRFFLDCESEMNKLCLPQTPERIRNKNETESVGDGSRSSSRQ